MSPHPDPLPIRASRGEGEDRCLPAAVLDSMAVGNGRGAMSFLMSFATEPEIVTVAWIDNASVQFPLNIYATKGSPVR